MSKHSVLASFASFAFVLQTAGLTGCIPGFQLGSSSSSVGPRPGAPVPASTSADSSAPAAQPDHDEHIEVVRVALKSAMQELDVAKIHEENLERASSGSGQRFTPVGNACVAAVDLAITQGVPTSTELTVLGLTTEVITTLAEAKAKVCDVLLAKAKEWDARVAVAKKTTHDRVAAPYIKLGIAGDKLELLVAHIDVKMLGIGGHELTTPMQAKQANVIFELLESDREWTLRRYQFKGNALVATTSEGFVTRPGASKYR